MLRDKELLLYRNLGHGDILADMSELIYEYEFGYDEEENEHYRALLFNIVHRLIELAASHGYKGNLWHMYLTYLLANNENAYSTAAELLGSIDGTLNDVALHDFKIFKEMFDYDFSGIDENLTAGCLAFIEDYSSANEESKLFNKRVRDRICELAVALANAADVIEFKNVIDSFYKDFGVGKFGLHKAFRVYHDEQDKVIIRPITNIAHVYLEDLVGY